MFPEQTVQAHLDLKGDVLHPVHWGTFNLALHPWYEPMERLTAAADLKNVRIATPVAGETTVYDMRIPAAKWWEQAMPLSAVVNNASVIEGNIQTSTNK
jgi:L-ascorbate metabolism protein UlaG (beta-lactamase superfamily)